MGSLFIFWIYNIDQKKSIKQKNARIDKIKIEKTEKELVDKLVSKYGAQTDWHKILKGKDSNLNDSFARGNFFTYDLQKAVENTNKKPIAIKLRVEDIYKKKDKVIVRFAHEKIFNAPEFSYELECNEELVAKIIKAKNKMSRRDFLRKKLFLVIASLESVNNYKLEISSDEMSGDIYASDIELPHYISGKCIDLEKIG
jgi:hypothetical protein